MGLPRSSSDWFKAAAAKLSLQSVPMPSMEIGPVHGPVTLHGMLRTQQHTLSSWALDFAC